MRGSFFIDREVFNRNEEKTPVKNRNHRQRSLKSQEELLWQKSTQHLFPATRI